MIGLEMKDIKEYQRLLREELKKLDDDIYDTETKYLEETGSSGNSLY